MFEKSGRGFLTTHSTILRSNYVQIMIIWFDETYKKMTSYVKVASISWDLQGPKVSGEKCDSWEWGNKAPNFTHANNIPPSESQERFQSKTSATLTKLVAIFVNHKLDNLWNSPLASTIGANVSVSNCAVLWKSIGKKDGDQ